MPTYNEVMDAIRIQDQKARKEREPFNRAKVEVARRAQMAVEHPGWQLFVRDMEEKIERLDSNLASLRRMFSVGITGNDVALLHQKVIQAEATLAAYTAILNVIPGFIQQGEQAAAELKSL